MIRSGLSSEVESHQTDPSRGGTLILLSVAVSIDAFAVGLSLAMLSVPIAYPVVVIGVVTAGLSVVGLHLGNRLGKAFGKRMEIIGGVILIAIGIRIVVSHLWLAGMV
jgi:putative Mn2+ efflux pump MntP